MQAWNAFLSSLFVLQVLFLPFLVDSCPGSEVRAGLVLELQELFEGKPTNSVASWVSAIRVKV